MLLAITLTLLGLALLSIIGFSMYQQYQAKVASEIKFQLDKQKLIIAETQDLLHKAEQLAFPNSIITTLYVRIKNALIQANSLESRPNYPKLIEQMDKAISLTSSMQSAKYPLEQFSVPTDDQGMITCVQSLKRLKSILHNEFQSGRMTSTHHIEGNKHIANLQIRINILSKIHRAKAAMNVGQFGTSHMLLLKAKETLEPVISGSEDAFIVKSHQVVEELLKRNNELKEKSSSSAEPIEADQTDLEQLFSPKKKW